MAGDRRREIVEAAAKGVREYITSIRGANVCGSDAVVEINQEGRELDVRMKDGEVWAFFYEI